MNRYRWMIKNIKDYGTLVLIAGLPLYLVRFKIGLPTTLLEIIFWVVFSAWLADKYLNKEFGPEYFRQRLQYPFAFGLILLVLSSFIGLAVSGFSSAAMGVYKAYFVEAGLFFVLVFNYFKYPENREKVYLALGVSAFFVSIYAIYQRLTGDMWSGDATRVTSIFPYPNAIGLYLGPIAILMFSKFISDLQKILKNNESGVTNKETHYTLYIIHNSKNTVFYFLVVLFSFIAIFFAKSEGSIIGLIAALVVMGFLYNKKSAVATLMLLIIGLGIIFSVPKLRDFAIEKATLSDFSGEVRKQQWRETWQAFRAGKFVSGCGLSNYQACVAPYHQAGIFFNKDRDPKFRNQLVWGPPEYKATHWFPVEIYMYPHNILLNFWSELSIVGLVAVVILIVQFFYFGWRQLVIARREATKQSNSNEIATLTPFARNDIIILGLMGAMTQIIIHGLVDVPYFKNDLSFLWWLILAMIGVYRVELNFKK